MVYRLQRSHCVDPLVEIADGLTQAFTRSFRDILAHGGILAEAVFEEFLELYESISYVVHILRPRLAVKVLLEGTIQRVRKFVKECLRGRRKDDGVLREGKAWG